MPKLAFSANAFRKFSMFDTIKMIADAGFEGIEIMCDTPHCWPDDVDDEYLASIKREIRVNNLEISNLNAFMMCKIGDFQHPSWIEPDPSYRLLRVSHTEKCLKIAWFLGVKNISTQPGGPTVSADRATDLEVFKHGVKRVLESAEALDVNFLIEPEPDLLIQHSYELREFIAALGSRFAGMNCDLGHFFCVDEDPSWVIRDYGDIIGHIHLEDIKDRKHYHLPPGDGDMDFDSIFAALDEIKYDGWVTVELYPFLDNPGEVAKKSRAFLRRWV